jgi:hypothetical protein
VNARFKLFMLRFIVVLLFFELLATASVWKRLLELVLPNGCLRQRRKQLHDLGWERVGFHH